MVQALVLSVGDREALERIGGSCVEPHRRVVAAGALLALADGASVRSVARGLGSHQDTVRRWRDRFLESGADGIGRVAPGRGRRRVIGGDAVAAIVADTLYEAPPDGSVCWSTRSMAERHGVGKDTVARIWRARGLKPWRSDVFKLSADPCFEDELVDVVGLYADPPERAAVFSFDEKTQVQALDRTQPSLPIKPGRARWHLHFTPTSSSWLNLIEGWFSILARKALKNNSFTSIQDLEHTIDTWTSHWNENPRPLKWTKPANDILAKTRRAQTALTKSATHH